MIVSSKTHSLLFFIFPEADFKQKTFPASDRVKRRAITSADPSGLGMR